MTPVPEGIEAISPEATLNPSVLTNKNEIQVSNFNKKKQNI